MLRFTPAAAGSSLAVVSGARALLVRIPDAPVTVDALWDAVSTGASIQAVVEVLASGGLFSTPPFALFQATAGAPGARSPGSAPPLPGRRGRSARPAWGW